MREYLVKLLYKRVNSNTFKLVFKNKSLKRPKNQEVTLLNYFLIKIND
jgi:hypothetical protein